MHFESTPSAVILSDSLCDKIEWDKKIVNKVSLKMSSKMIGYSSTPAVVIATPLCSN